MILSVFLKTFYLCFLVLISVGPVFITTANISMTKGYKTGLYCILGCILGDSIFIILGALAAKTVVSLIPEILINFLSLLAGCFLLYIAYGFWKTDIKNIKSIEIKTKNNISLSIKMLFLTLSSPLSIVGYSLIFSQVIDTSMESSIISAIFGGILAAIFTHNLIVFVFSFIGKKINLKVMSVLNRLSAILISCFASILIFNFFKFLYKVIVNLF